MDPDDQALITAYKNGDPDAFGVLYDRYIERIYRFIYYKTFDTATAEDLTSSTFYKALTKIDTLDLSRGNFSTWIYRIARNTVIDHYRTDREETGMSDDVFDLPVDDRTVESLDARHALATVTSYLKNLSAEQREIITLRIWEERSYKEIAEIIGGTEGSVKMSFSRTIRKLREDLGPLTTLALLMLLNTPVTNTCTERIL